MVDTMVDIPDHKSFEPYGGIGRLLNLVRASVFDSLDTELEPLDITAAQCVIVASLANGSAESASGLCKGISYDPGAMTRMIDRLEQKGLIRRVRSTEDRRTAKLELTAEGRAIYPKLIKSAMTVMNRHLHGFTKAEVRELQNYLQRMLDNA